MLMSSILEGLNSRQQEAVLQIEGPVLVTAGAGSGKTKVLTCRIAHILETGVAPQRILAITFTNKAAKEMQERVALLIGDVAKSMWISTFHSFCAKLLRMHLDGKFGYHRNFVIYDSTDQLTVVKKMLKELQLDENRFLPHVVLSTISNAKNALLTAKEWAKQAGDFYQQKVAEVYFRYERELRENNALDFDDLLTYTVKLLQEDETIRERYQERFQYILIDEYQDTNYAQYMLTRILAKKWRNICVVGDADQSIYAWRGADIRNIIDFTRDYPEAVSIKLEQNYRSTKTILQAANAVISHNEKRPSKVLWTDNECGKKIIHYQGATERDEADYVAGCIYNRHDKRGEPYGDMAILFRINAQSRILEEELIRRGIPYTMVGGTKFYDRKEIKDVIAYLRLLVNPQDSLSLLRVINVPKRGVGQITLEKVVAYAEERQMSVFYALTEVENIDIAARVKQTMKAFIDVIFSLAEKATTMDVFSLLEAVIKDTGYGDLLAAEARKDTRGETRQANVGEFLSVAKEYVDGNPNGTIQDFLETVALVSDADSFENKESQVTLMSLHAAKGLEFPIVFLVGLEEGLFPHSRSLMDPMQLEEERRLAYVGITRAERQLYVTNAISRMWYGSISSHVPSRFLAEIPAELKDVKEMSRLMKQKRFSVLSKQRVSVLSTAVSTTLPKKHQVDTSIQKGDLVQHKIWGKGKVVEVFGSGDSMQLKIQFPTQGVRQVMVKYAPIEKV